MDKITWNYEPGLGVWLARCSNLYLRVAPHSEGGYIAVAYNDVQQVVFNAAGPDPDTAKVKLETRLTQYDTQTPPPEWKLTQPMNCLEASFQGRMLRVYKAGDNWTGASLRVIPQERDLVVHSTTAQSACVLLETQARLHPPCVTVTPTGRRITETITRAEFTIRYPDGNTDTFWSMPYARLSPDDEMAQARAFAEHEWRKRRETLNHR